MNEIVYKILLAEDIFLAQMHLRQTALTYCACGSFTKNKEINKKFKETGDSRYIYQNELDKAYFPNFKDLSRRTFADKLLRTKAFNIAKDPKHDGYQRRLASMVYNCFDRKTSRGGIKNELLETNY